MSEMEDSGTSEPFHHHAKYKEETLQNEPDSPLGSVLCDDDKEKQDCLNPCQEKLVPQTVPCKSLFEKYVSKTTLTQGEMGKRPHLSSMCTFILESILLLNLSFGDVITSSSKFHSNCKGKETNLCLGTSNTELERALELALLDMCKGERSEIILSATQRVGKGRDKDVEPVACLKCVIHLKEVNGASEKLKFANNFKYSPMRASEEEKYVSALNDKVCGVELFKQFRFVDAFHRFAAGAKTLMTTDSFLLELEDKSRKILCLFSVLCSNMAECQLRENNPLRAISLCQRALIHDPQNVKALYRHASASWITGKVDEADSLLKELFKLDPNNLAGKRLYNEVRIKIQDYKEEYTKIIRRMFKPL